jgi:hypothetical protein
LNHPVLELASDHLEDRLPWWSRNTFRPYFVFS